MIRYDLNRTKKGSALIVVMIIVAVLIAYSLVMNIQSISNATGVKQSVAKMSALYIAESGLDMFLARIQANRVDAIKIPLNSGPSIYPGPGYPGLGEDWKRITLQGIHYFVSPVFHIPKENPTPEDVNLTVLSVPDGTQTFVHAEDGTGISAADDRKIYHHSIGSFFIRVAYFRKDLEDADNDEDIEEYLPWGGHNPVPNPLDNSFFSPFYIQISSVVHLHPRSNQVVEQMEGYLDANLDQQFSDSDGDIVVDADGNGLRNLCSFRKVSYQAVRIVEGVLFPQTVPNVSELIKGAIVNVGTSPEGTFSSEEGGAIEFENQNSMTIIKGRLLSNSPIKVGSHVLNTTNELSIHLKKAAIFLDKKGYSIFQYGWNPADLSIQNEGGETIFWNPMDIVNPLDAMPLYKYPYLRLLNGVLQDSSSPSKMLASPYLQIAQANLLGSAEEIDSQFVEAGSSSQLFDFDRYLAVAASTRVIQPNGNILDVPGVYYDRNGNVVPLALSPRTDTGDIDWFSLDSLASPPVAFHGPAGWVFKDIPAFALMMSKAGELHGIVVVNIPNPLDLSNETNNGLNGGLKRTSASGSDFPGNPEGKIHIKGTIVFRFASNITPNTKIKIQSALLINPATFPSYPSNYGDEELAATGNAREAEKIALRDSLIPPTDPLFFNYTGDAPSGYPDTQAKRELFYEQSHAVPGIPKTVFPSEVDIQIYRNPNGAPEDTFRNFGEGTLLPDYPAMMFNQSVIDIHSTANVCGVVFGPSFGEIENKGETAFGNTNPLYQYFVGAILIGNGLKIKNYANSLGQGPFSDSNPWKASVFIYQASCLDQLMISNLVVPLGPPSWKLQSIYIGK